MYFSLKRRPHPPGKLAPGYLADWVVVDTQTWNNPVEMWRLGEDKNKEVWVHGQRRL